MTYSGLTWDHPRGYDALAAAAEKVREESGEQLVDWSKQPLEGFESAPIAELAKKHDLVVFDHPHLGEAVATGCLAPLEEFFGEEEIDSWRQSTVGKALDSYRWEGRTYGLPLDVAAQVTARRPDMVAEAPAHWKDVLELSKEAPVALSLAGPHALLTFYSIASGLGERLRGGQMAEAAMALSIIEELYWRAPRETREMNPIELLETMAGGDSIALVPLVFGYVTYAAEGNRKNRIAFSDAPRFHWVNNGRGTVLGGTGIGISKGAKPSPKLLDHLRWLLDDEVQRGFITAHSGQPSSDAAWRDAGVNESCGGFYRDTHATVSGAIVRPRFDGCVAFQLKASEIIREGVAAATEQRKLLEKIRTEWCAARKAARGDLDERWDEDG